MPFILCKRRDAHRSLYLHTWPTPDQVAKLVQRWEEMGPSAAASDPYGFWIPLSDPKSEMVLAGSWDEYAWWGDHPGGAKGYKDKAALVALAEARFAALPEVFHTSKGRPIWWPKLKSVIIVDQAQEMLRYAAKGPRDEWGRPIGR